jgi:purine-nucleoside phosphorylase
MTASMLAKDALALCTVSDHILTGESVDASARQTTFTDMMTLALEIAIAK